MKTTTFILCSVLLATSPATASRTINETIRLSEDQEVFIKLKFADEINIIPVSGNTLRIEGHVDINNGESDEAYELSIDKTDSELRIESDLINKHMHYRTVRVRNRNGDISSSSHTIDIQASFDIFVPKGRKLTVKSINAILNLQNQDAPVIAESINGEIGLALSKNADVDLEIRTIHGECYTNLEFQLLENTNGLRQIGGRTRAKARLNKGGTPIHLKTINGYMYVRELTKEHEG